jgi:hypothetical protein
MYTTVDTSGASALKQAPDLIIGFDALEENILAIHAKLNILENIARRVRQDNKESRPCNSSDEMIRNSIVTILAAHNSKLAEANVRFSDILQTLIQTIGNDD